MANNQRELLAQMHEIRLAVDQVNMLLRHFIADHSEDYKISAFVQINDGEFNSLRVSVSQMLADFGKP